MSEYQKTIVGIRGDGNAVGDNNQITVIKNEKHHHHHGPNENDAGSVWAIVVLVLVAIVAACYYFSRNASDIYLVLGVTGWGEALAALIATGAYARRGSYGVAAKTAVVMLCALSVLMVSSVASHRYPAEIVELAQRTESFKTFWCGLSVYGRQLALLHTLVAGIVLTPAALLLLAPTLVTTFFGLVEMEVTASFYKTIELATSWVLITAAGLLVALAAYAHSDVGWNTWAEKVRNPPAWPFCPK